MNSNSILFFFFLAALSASAKPGDVTSLGVSSAAAGFGTYNPKTGNHEQDIESLREEATHKYTIVNFDMQIDCNSGKYNDVIRDLCNRAYGDKWRRKGRAPSVNADNMCLVVKDMRLAINELGAVQLMNSAGVWKGIPDTKDGANHVSRDKDPWYWNDLAHPAIPGAGGFQLARECNKNAAVGFANAVVMSTFWEFGPEASKEHPSTQDLWKTPVIGSAVGEIFWLVRKSIGDLSTPTPSRLQMVTRALNLESLSMDIQDKKVGLGDENSGVGRFNLAYDVAGADGREDRHPINAFVGGKLTRSLTKFSSGCGWLDQWTGTNCTPHAKKQGR